jgi:serine/threonine protein kinase
MQTKKVLHRDLKLANILLNCEDSGVLDVRISDYGFSKICNDNEVNFSMCGTPSYIAPEILRGEPYNYKADIFSIGSIMFNLLTGRYLFPGNDSQVIL